MFALRTTVLSLAAAGAISLPAAAAEVAGSGTVTYIFRHLGDRPIAGGNALGQDHLKAIILADDPANPLNMTEHDCLGGSIIGPNGDTGNGAGYCDGIDKDGDVYFIWYRNDGADRRWGFLGGTGKFAGVDGGGTTEVVGGTPDGRVVVKWQGKWAMQGD